MLYGVEALVGGILHSLILAALHVDLLRRGHHVWQRGLVRVATHFIRLHLLVRCFVLCSLISALSVLSFVRVVASIFLVGAPGVLGFFRDLLRAELAWLMAHLLELLTAHELRLLSLDLRVELLDILARGQIGQIRLVRLVCLICSVGLLRSPAGIALTHL